MDEQTKRIQADIERTVAHLARVHGTRQDAIWAAMRRRSEEETARRV